MVKDVRPILFLDVDGVINACDPELDVELIERRGFKIRFQPWIRSCLALLHEYFEVVWMTTWQEDAEPSFAEVLNLPGERPYVPWGGYDTGSMKIPALLQWAAGRPWAFVDDDVNWELRRLRRDRDSFDGLIIIPDPKVGLTVDQTDALVAYAEGLKQED